MPLSSFLGGNWGTTQDEVNMKEEEEPEVIENDLCWRDRA